MEKINKQTSCGKTNSWKYNYKIRISQRHSSFFSQFFFTFNISYLTISLEPKSKNICTHMLWKTKFDAFNPRLLNIHLCFNFRLTSFWREKKKEYGLWLIVQFFHHPAFCLFVRIVYYLYVFIYSVYAGWLMKLTPAARAGEPAAKRRVTCNPIKRTHVAADCAHCRWADVLICALCAASRCRTESLLFPQLLFFYRKKKEQNKNIFYSPRAWALEEELRTLAAK